MTNQYDVIVVGAGPGGYVAAIRAAQLGLKTACVEKWIDDSGASVLGGTCLNVGCIPSKALLESSHKYHELSAPIKEHGISVSHVEFDLSNMMARKDKVVNKLTSGVGQLFKANGVDVLVGTGKLLADKIVAVTDANGSVEQYQAQNVILSPGSKPIEIPSAKFSEGVILDNVGALDMEAVPKRIGIIGGGVIGLELASVWSRLGAEVTIFEALVDLLPMTDKDVARETKKLLKHQNIDVRLNAKVTATNINDLGVEVTFETPQGTQTSQFDKLVVAVGRVPNTKGLFADNTGVNIDKRGFIEVDAHCSTGVEGIYAIGDATRGPMLAHKASEEGVMVVERIIGRHTQVNYDCIPSVIYTHPEIAWVGKTQQSLEQEGRKIKVGKFPMSASGRSVAAGEAEGFVKVIADKDTDAVLGVHVVSAVASELIAQAVLTMDYGATLEDIQLTMFAHPTVSEALHEAALAADGHAIHYVNRVKH